MSSTQVLNVSMGLCKSVKTTVTCREADVDAILEEFVTKSRKKYLIIGLDTELIPADSQQKRIALLQLCDGNQCLIIQLLYLEEVPRSLHNFLRLPIVTLVGVGVKKNMEMLEKEYGLQCRKAVDIDSSCAASSDQMRIPVIQVQGSVSDGDFASVLFSDWDESNLTNAQIKCATLAAYVAWEKGDHLPPKSLN